MGAFSYAVLDSAGKRTGLAEPTTCAMRASCCVIAAWFRSMWRKSRGPARRQRSQRVLACIAFRGRVRALHASSPPVSPRADRRCPGRHCPAEQAATSDRSLRAGARGVAAAAMSLHRGHFHRCTVRRLPRASTGRLDLVLNRLADHTEASHRARQKVHWRDLSWALLGLAVVVVAGLLTYIVPDVVGVLPGKGGASSTHPGTARYQRFPGWLWCLAVVRIVAGVFAVRASLKTRRGSVGSQGPARGALAGRLSLTSNTARFTYAGYPREQRCAAGGYSISLPRC
jgi:hypothetical protein